LIALFDLSAGSVVVVAGGGTPSPTATITPVKNGWYRCSVLFNQGTASNRTFRIFVVEDAETTANGSIASRTGDGTSGIYIWGAQLEAGSKATSYIPTTGATATRAADVASIAGSAFSSWYNQPEGTLFIDAASSQSTAAANVGIVLNDGTLSNRIELDVRSGSLGGAGRATIASGGSVSFDTGNSSSPAFVVNTSYRQAGAYKLDSFAYSLNGGFTQTDLLGEVPVAPDRAEIGARLVTGLPLNGTVKRISYWKTALPLPTLQAITG
jgi:hypothetical protein